VCSDVTVVAVVIIRDQTAVSSSYSLNVANNMHHTSNEFRSYYKIPVRSDMFRWQPPP
jgi:hypothetical protein